MKNRKLQSHIYHGWRVKKALKHAATTADIVLREEERLVNSSNLLDTKKEKYYYLYNHDGGYRVKLTKEEADYYKTIEDREN